MIILSDEREKIDPPYLGPTVRLPEEAALRSVPSLPDYDTSQQEHGVLKPTRNREPHCNARFFRAAFCAFLVYVAISLSVAVPLAVFKTRQPKQWKTAPSYSLWSGDEAANTLPLQTLRDLLSDNQIRCNVWDIAETSSSNPLLLATTHYNLSAQGLVTIRSNISYTADTFSGINGSLTVDINKNSKECGVVFIVNILSSNTRLRDRTTVCFTDSGPNRGLTIYVPNQLEPEDTLSFSVQVLLPAKSTIATLITYLPLFTQSFGDLAKKYWFDQLIIEGTNNWIRSRRLAAAQISVKNALASIYGSFNVTNSLTLDTIRGAIIANITLLQSPLSVQPSFLSLDNGYSPIDANITLSMTTPVDPSFSPSFVSQVKTFNGAINLGVSHDLQTPSSMLTLQVQNALAPTHVQMDSSFQGTFSSQTKLDQVTVQSHITSSKSGSNSTGVRTIQFDQQSPGKSFGWVGLGTRPIPGVRTRGQGHIEIMSSLSPIVLDLG